MEETLIQLIEMLKSASPHIWEVLIKQVYLEATFGSVFAGLFFLGFVFCLYWAIVGAWALHRENNEDGYCTQWSTDEVFVWGTISIVLFVILVLIFDTSVIRLFNPEFYALQYILESLK